MRAKFFSHIYASSFENGLVLRNWGHANSSSKSGLQRFYSGPRIRTYFNDKKTQQLCDLQIVLEKQRAIDVECKEQKEKLPKAYDDLALSFLPWGTYEDMFNKNL